MLKRNVRRRAHAARPPVHVVLALEDRSTFASLFQVLIAVDRRLKKTKKVKDKETQPKYELDDCIIDLVFIECCFILLSFIKHQAGAAYDRYYCFITQQQHVSVA